MRVLEPDVLFKVSILLMMMIVLLVVNLIYSIGRKRTWIHVNIHVCSFFLGVYLFCLFTQIVILDLPFEKYYQRIGNVALLLTLGTFTITLLLLVFYKRKRLPNMYKSPELSSVFVSMDDTVVICHYDGTVVEMNESSDRESLFGEVCTTIDDIIASLIDITPQCQHEHIVCELTDFNRKHQFEISYRDHQQFFLVTVSPIMADKTNCIGTALIFHDITDEKKMIHEIDKQNGEAQKINQKLVDYVKVANVLESEKERLRILQNVQADLIEDIEKVIGEISDIQALSDLSLEDRQEKATVIAKELRHIYTAVRSSIYNIKDSAGGELCG